MPIGFDKCQHEFQTCYEVWQELEAEARTHHLTDEQQDEILKMMDRYKFNRQKSYELKGDEQRKFVYKEVYPLKDAIKSYCIENGYPNLIFVKDGKKGLRSIDGKEILPPIYEDIRFTYDYFFFVKFFYGFHYVVKSEGKWGVIDNDLKTIIPFEYDCIFRKPESDDYYILIKDGKQGMANIEGRYVTIPITVSMDAIYYVPIWDLTLFTRGGKWGWWWWTNEVGKRLYENYSEPKYDGILVQRGEDIHVDHEYDQYIYARLGKELKWILYWTNK